VWKTLTWFQLLTLITLKTTTKVVGTKKVAFYL